MPQTPDAAKSFNDQLRVTAVAVAGASADGHAYGFLCQCGCGETVTLDLAGYDEQGGAWRDGHKPHPPARFLAIAGNGGTEPTS